MTHVSGLPVSDAPHVTVLMAARNAAGYLGEAIESIRSQTFGDWELVIVDDASDDTTPQIIADYMRVEPRIRTITRTEQGGPAAAAIDGLSTARGRYVARMDADDVSLPHRLEGQLAFLAANPSLRACTGDVKVITDGGLRDLGPRETPSLPGALKWGLAVRGFLQSTFLFEKDALVELGGYKDLPVSEDHYIYCGLARRRWLGALPEVLVHWRMHEGQLTDRSFELLQRLGAQVVADHLSELSDELWTQDDSYRLRSIGQRPLALREGLALIARFERAWRSDVTLSRDEAVELARLTWQLRYDHFRTLARERVGSVSWGRSALDLYRRLRPVRS